MSFLRAAVQVAKEIDRQQRRAQRDRQRRMREEERRVRAAEREARARERARIQAQKAAVKRDREAAKVALRKLKATETKAFEKRSAARSRARQAIIKKVLR